MADTEKKAPSKAPGLLSQINKQATLRGSINSTINSTMRGAAVISSAGAEFKKETKNILQPGRVETFAQAMDRLDVNSKDLPLIHNQILLQVYLTLSLAVIALCIGLQFFVRGVWVSGILSFIIGLTCLANFSQSSIRAYQVRHKKLGAANEWFSNPGEWLPSRMGGLVDMDRTDPLRHPVLVNSLVGKARLFMFLGAMMLGVAVGVHSASFQAVPIALVGALYFLAVGFFVNGSRFSFEVFKRRKGLQCDLLYWVVSPSTWVPSKQAVPVKAASKKEAFNGS